MKFLNPTPTLTLFLLIMLSVGPVAVNANHVVSQATANLTRLEVWSPDLHSSNITSLDAGFQPGSMIVVRVNVTGAGPLLGFDVSLRYNITVGPNVLQAIHPQVPDPFSGGLFDPASNPSNCNIAVAKSDLDIPAGRIRYAASTQSGCTEPGSGTLFSITFQVTGVGATTIDLVLVASTIVGGVGSPPTTTIVPYSPFNAYFRNKPGIPPIPRFTFAPTSPIQGDSVLFNATNSRDPDNPLATNHGMQMDPVVYDTDNNLLYDSGEPVIAGSTPAPGTPLGSPPFNPSCRIGCISNQPDSHIVFVDSNHNGVWDPGETVVYDRNQNLGFGEGDFVISGAIPTIGAPLSFDPKLTFVDAHHNGFWDNGYIWDWGDSSIGLSTGNVTSHVFQSATTVPIAGRFTVRLVVWDIDNQLPAEIVAVVSVAKGFQQLLSSNWSGYAIFAPPGSVTDVKGSWIVPGIIGSCTSVDAHAAMWVGIDGLTSQTVEQTGTDSACVKGTLTYFAWYEFFPKPSVKINAITVHPGDVMFGEVQFAGNDKFVVTLVDQSTGISFSKAGHVSNAQMSSAEWITEAPSSKSGQLPLADFGVSMFGQDYTAVGGTCAATVGQTSGVLGSFGSSVAVITMGHFPLISAQPTDLTQDKTSFSVVWRAP